MVHIGVHSFTPVLNGVTRAVDVGFLFDPARLGEAAFCRAWQQALHRRCPTWRVRRNVPYRGVNDGLTTTLRQQTSPDAYWGIELEMNQAMASLPARAFAQCRRHIVAALGDVWPLGKAEVTP